MHKKKQGDAVETLEICTKMCFCLDFKLYKLQHKVASILRQGQTRTLCSTFSYPLAVGLLWVGKISQMRQFLFFQGQLSKRGEIYEPLAVNTHKSWRMGALTQKRGLRTPSQMSYGKSKQLNFEINI